MRETTEWSDVVRVFMVAAAASTYGMVKTRLVIAGLLHPDGWWPTGEIRPTSLICPPSASPADMRPKTRSNR